MRRWLSMRKFISIWPSEYKNGNDNKCLDLVVTGGSCSIQLRISSVASTLLWTNGKRLASEVLSVCERSHIPCCISSSSKAPHAIVPRLTTGLPSQCVRKAFLNHKGYGHGIQDSCFEAVCERAMNVMRSMSKLMMFPPAVLPGLGCRNLDVMSSTCVRRAITLQTCAHKEM